MPNLKEVIYLSNADYNTLISTGSITISGVTIAYDDNTVYMTPSVEVPEPPASGEVNLHSKNGVIDWQKYGFKYISAPSSTTLTDSQIADIINGAIITGSFLSRSLSVFFPAIDDGTDYVGMIMSCITSSIDKHYLQVYKINKSTKVISAITGSIGFLKAGGLLLNAKEYPTYPSDLTKQYRFVQQDTSGNLAWQQDYKQVVLTQAEYDLLPSKDANTLYYIEEA